MNRRNVLIGLGGVVAGGGALLGTGAFTTVEAERTVNIETEDDADAFLGLSAERGDFEDEGDEERNFVTSDDGTIQINLDGSSPGLGDGLNQDAITTFRNLVRVSNNATQTIDELTLEFTETPGNVAANNTFAFPVDQVDGDGTDDVDHDDAVNILTGNNSIPSQLGPGEEVIFGLTVDLLNGGDGGSLPGDGDYTLTIGAETQDND